MSSVPLKERDFAPQIEEHPEQLPAQDVGSDSDSSSSDSSDAFDWDEDDDESKQAKSSDKVYKAKRGRAVWLAFMKLARPIRVLFLGVVGTAILITPLLVFQLRFESSVAQPHVHAWSLWFAIIWAAGCITSIVVDNITRFIIAIIILFGGQAERLKIQLEVGDGHLIPKRCADSERMPSRSPWLLRTG
jgi:hypothetical protein